MKLLIYIASVALMLSSTSVGAITTWYPTSGDTDFIQLDFGGPNGMGITTNGGDLYLFDDDTGLVDGEGLKIGQDGGEVVFTDNGGFWTAEVHGESITLTGGNEFLLAITWDNGGMYYGDSYSSLVGDDSYLIVFDENPGLGECMEPGYCLSGSTLAIDLAPVPVPAAAWLFGSGLLGLVGVARRRINL